MDGMLTNTPQKNIEYLNKFNMTGSVVHKYRPRPDVIVLTIAVKGHDIHDVDYPNVTFYGEERADTIDKGIVIVDGSGPDKREGRILPRVRIEGTVQTSRKQTDSGTRFYQSFVGIDIAKAQTQMERQTGRVGIGSRKAESENDICLLGDVVNVYPIIKGDSERPIGVSVTLRTQTNGRINFPRVSCFNTQVPRAMALKNGDVVCITGFAETTNRTRDDGSRVRYESVIATEIAHVDG